MSGPRPTHLTRRGAVYVVRFRLPADLARRTGVDELRRSLFTKDLAEARCRCLLASDWFSRAVEQLRQMKDVSRSDLEGAARQFFGKLREEVDQPRDLPADNYDQELDFQLSSSRDLIGELDDQLRSNRYSPGVQWTANELVRLVGATLPELTEQLRLVAMQLAARAEREQMEYLTHQLTNPASVFAPSDQLFLPGTFTPPPSAFHSPPGHSDHGAQAAWRCRRRVSAEEENQGRGAVSGHRTGEVAGLASGGSRGWPSAPLDGASDLDKVGGGTVLPVFDYP